MRAQLSYALHAAVAIMAVCFATLTPLTAAERTAPKPNILLIMADDLGAEALACYGNTSYSTPHLDRMAEQGARFDSAYSTPICSPTRAMILTGLYPNRTGILERLDSPDDKKNLINRLPAHLKTFGTVFKSAGYSTAISGKWHLGNFRKYPDQPKSHGFDEYCLWVQFLDSEKHSRYFAPYNYENGAFRQHPKEVYGPDHYSDFLIDFMKRNKDKPFLAYYPMNLIHGPIHEPPPTFKKLAESNFPKDLGKKERLNGYMITYMDAIVGKLLKALDELGLSENTLVIFTGDNGCGGFTNRLGKFRVKGGKRWMNEAGTRVPFIARWPGRIPPGTRKQFFSLVDVLPTLAKIANIPLQDEVDGMDLSHNLFDKPGTDREYFFMAFEGDCYFVRDRRFRLHEDGRFYDVSVESNETRYNMKVLNPAVEAEVRARLQKQLDDYMKIRKTDDSYRIIPFGTNGDAYRKLHGGRRKPRKKSGNDE